MLSNIVSTKERAYGYSKSNEATKSGILLSKGTLIVVPSASELKSLIHTCVLESCKTDPRLT
jgi:hypothetical protein